MISVALSEHNIALNYLNEWDGYLTKNEMMGGTMRENGDVSEHEAVPPVFWNPVSRAKYHQSIGMCCEDLLGAQNMYNFCFGGKDET